MNNKAKEIMEKKKRSAKAAIEAFCHQCMGYWQDGKEDCENTKCPLYRFMPYGRLEPDMEWVRYNTKKIGKVLEEDIERKELSEEQKKAAADRLRKAREKER